MHSINVSYQLIYTTLPIKRYEESHCVIVYYLGEKTLIIEGNCILVP